MSKPSTSTTYFITGGNRGIGFNLARDLSISSDNIVLASIRGSPRLTKNEQLQSLSKKERMFHVVELEITEEDSINKLPEEIKKIPGFGGIVVVILNSGVADSYFKALDTPQKVWLDHYSVNTLGPTLVLQKIYPILL